MKTKETRNHFNVRTLTGIAMLSAAATVLMFISFSVPLMPGFIKLDFSELPALLAAYAFGPISGAAVCLVKNAINVLFTTTGGVGELSNWVLGMCFVIPAGLIYKYYRNRRGAMVGALVGAVVMAGMSILTNYFIMYPLYTAFMPMDVILGMYRAINPNVETLWEALIWFNMPFTFVKGMCSFVMALVIYKPLSPILKGTYRKSK